MKSTTIKTTEKSYRLYGHDALKEVGMPLALGEQIAAFVNDTMNVAIAVRGNSSFHLFEEPSVPKNIDIKAKTGTWGLTKGVIATDSSLGRHDKGGRPVNLNYSKPDFIKSMQHKITLREIVLGLNSNPAKYELVQPLVKSTQQNSYLMIKPVLDSQENAPKFSDITFCINLSNKNKSAPNKIDTFNYSNDKLILARPEWWNDGWGDFLTLCDSRFPLEYQLGMNEKSRKPVEIFAIEINRNDQNILLPVTNDIDLLWISHPAKNNQELISIADMHNIKMHEAVDGHNRTAANSLLSSLNILKSKFANIFRMNDNHQPLLSDIAKLGRITPFEALVTHVINSRLSNFSSHIKNLFQHGAENRNPGILSDINGKVLHFWKSQYNSYP